MRPRLALLFWTGRADETAGSERRCRSCSRSWRTCGMDSTWTSKLSSWWGFFTPMITCNVHRFDYIMRDCHAVGDKGNISISRCVRIHGSNVRPYDMTRVLSSFPGLSTLRVSSRARYATTSRTQTKFTNCFIPGSLSTNGSIITRPVRLSSLLLCARAHTWDTAKAIEYMVIDALLQAEPYLKIADHVENPKRYVFLTDDLLNKIEASVDEVGPFLSPDPQTPKSEHKHRSSNPLAPSSSVSARATSTRSSTTRSFRTRTRI